MAEAGAATDGGASASVPRFIRFGLLGFVLTGAALFFVASSIKPDDVAGFAISERAKPQADGSFRLTIDARDRDTWVGVDLRAGQVVAGGKAPDLLVQRYLLRAPRGAMDLGKGSLASAAPPASPDWIPDTENGGKVTNAALSGWYDYSYGSHLLTTKEHTFAVRLADGDDVALVAIESYYCAPEGSGCLTLRYRLVGGS